MSARTELAALAAAAITLLIIALACLTANSVHAAKPFDAPPSSPEVRKWFAEAKSPKGGMCCDEADGYRLHWTYFYGDAKRELFDDWEIRSNHYWVHWDGHWIDAGTFADGKIVVPNLAGVAVVWVVGGSAPTVRCFAPDAGG